jgi:hypothetical protein
MLIPAIFMSRLDTQESISHSQRYSLYFLYSNKLTLIPRKYFHFLKSIISVVGEVI